MPDLRQLLIFYKIFCRKGSSINDVTVLERDGENRLCDESTKSLVINAWGGGQKLSNIAWRHLRTTPNVWHTFSTLSTYSHTSEHLAHIMILPEPLAYLFTYENSLNQMPLSWNRFNTSSSSFRRRPNKRRMGQNVLSHSGEETFPIFRLRLSRICDGRPGTTTF